MKHYKHTLFSTICILLFIFLLAFSQIIYTSFLDSEIQIRASETTDNNSSNNTSINNSNTSNETVTNENSEIDITNETTENSDLDNPNTTLEPPSVVSKSGIKTKPKQHKKPSKVTKTAYFCTTSVQLWPLQSIYNPISMKGFYTKYTKITWTVSDTSYAQVSTNGTVTLKKEGAGKTFTVTATLYYKNNGTTQTKCCSYVIYGQEPVRNLKINVCKNYIFIGKRLILKASCIPKNASCQKILWSSSNTAYATISQRGIVHPKKSGTGKTVTFTAATTDGSMILKSVTLRIIDPNKPMVALTFEDGPAPAYTTTIVNELEKFDARATFFVLGSRLTGESAKAIVRKAAKNGNEIASHTYNHKKLTLLSPGNIQQEASRTETIIKQLTGTLPSLTRPPYGSINDSVLKNINTPLILWSIDTLDAETKNKSKTVTAVMKHVKDGDIILMHDIYKPSADAACELIPKLIQQGYQLVTVSELAAYKNEKLNSGCSYSQIK